MTVQQDETTAWLTCFDDHVLAISKRSPSAKRDELISELRTIRNSMCRACSAAEAITRARAKP